jgi:hypothetical protein
MEMRAVPSLQMQLRQEVVVVVLVQLVRPFPLSEFLVLEVVEPMQYQVGFQQSARV